jgi:uncharacterized membrane-anchored protein YhcB (DUF1043 family)
MKIFRIIVATSIVAGFIWLTWLAVLPFGIFQFSFDGQPNPASGFSLVLSLEGHKVSSYPLTMIEIGWAGILTAWPYVFIGLLFGVMVGYPLGELAGRRFAIDKASKEALRKSSALTLDSFIGESHAKNIVKEIKSLFTDLPQLQKEVVAARKKILTMNVSAKEQIQNYEALQKKTDSLEKELIKARAKIRRLEDKANRPTGNQLTQSENIRNI